MTTECSGVCDDCTAWDILSEQIADLASVTTLSQRERMQLANMQDTLRGIAEVALVINCRDIDKEMPVRPNKELKVGSQELISYSMACPALVEYMR